MSNIVKFGKRGIETEKFILAIIIGFALVVGLITYFSYTLGKKPAELVASIGKVLYDVHSAANPNAAETAKEVANSVDQAGWLLTLALFVLLIGMLFAAELTVYAFEKGRGYGERMDLFKKMIYLIILIAAFYTYLRPEFAVLVWWLETLSTIIPLVLGAIFAAVILVLLTMGGHTFAKGTSFAASRAKLMAKEFKETEREIAEAKHILWETSEEEKEIKAIAKVLSDEIRLTKDLESKLRRVSDTLIKLASRISGNIKTGARKTLKETLMKLRNEIDVIIKEEDKLKRSVLKEENIDKILDKLLRDEQKELGKLYKEIGEIKKLNIKAGEHPFRATIQENIREIEKWVRDIENRIREVVKKEILEEIKNFQIEEKDERTLHKVLEDIVHNLTLAIAATDHGAIRQIPELLDKTYKDCQLAIEILRKIDNKIYTEEKINKYLGNVIARFEKEIEGIYKKLREIEGKLPEDVKKSR